VRGILVTHIRPSRHTPLWKRKRKRCSVNNRNGGQRLLDAAATRCMRAWDEFCCLSRESQDGPARAWDVDAWVEEDTLPLFTPLVVSAAKRRESRSFFRIQCARLSTLQCLTNKILARVAVNSRPTAISHGRSFLTSHGQAISSPWTRTSMATRMLTTKGEAGVKNHYLR
jgi:hypothetical protein